ncbi:MAG: hypothetical protein ABI112_04725 [Terracoccus sp.]
MNTMQTYDLRRNAETHAPERRDFWKVDVPDLTFLTVDGHGDPNTVAP